MNEEEKKAIAYLKFYIERDVMYENTHYEQIKTILNLIEKQQKEIEELKEKQTIYKEFKEELKPLIKNEFIPKDKIKEKIKYYNKLREKAETEKINDMFVNYIDCLEELLEESE